MGVHELMQRHSVVEIIRALCPAFNRLACTAGLAARRGKKASLSRATDYRLRQDKAQATIKRSFAFIEISAVLRRGVFLSDLTTRKHLMSMKASVRMSSSAPASVHPKEAYQGQAQAR